MCALQLTSFAHVIGASFELILERIITSKAGELDFSKKILHK